MKHNLFSRFISVLLAVVMLAGLMSMPSLADTVTGTDAAATDAQTTDSVDVTEEDTTDEAGSAPATLSEDGEEDKTAAGEEAGESDTQTNTVPENEAASSDAKDETASSDVDDSAAEETAPAAVQLTAEAKDENGTVVANVTAEADEGVIPEGATLVADLLTGNDAEAAGQELTDAGVDYDDYIALDIHLENDMGEEVEPDGEVRVLMVAPAALPENADPNTVTVQHHEEQSDGSVDVKEVASAAKTDATPAALSAEDTSAEQPTGVAAEDTDVTAAFDVESFSTFTITWGTQEDGEQVTVYYVATNGSQIKTEVTSNVPVNIGETVNLSGFVESITGYRYQYALLDNGPAENGDDGAHVDAIRYSEEDGWEYHLGNTWTEWQLPTGLNDRRVFLVYSVWNSDYNGDPGEEVDTVSSKDIKINLFDYDTDQINNGHTLQFKTSSAFPGGGDSDTKVNPNYWTTYSGGSEGGALQGIVKNKLSAQGFPVLQDSTDWNFEHTYLELVSGWFGERWEWKTANITWNPTSDESLDYLFNTKEEDGKKVVEGADHLFQQDADGYYYYDSSKNIAVIDEDTNNFKVYSKSSGLFNPFKLASENNSLNSHFGMTIETSFVLPENGQVNGQDMVFEFTGDDDVWVFIDDVLVLDIGGIHGAVSGTINFNSGKVWIDQVNQGTLGNSEETPETLTIQQLFEAAGAEWNDETYSPHTLKFFYLERGAGSSNCKIRFNLPIIPKASLIVSKDLAATGSDALQSYLEDTMTYRFRVVNTRTSNSYFAKDFVYNIMEGGKKVGTGKVGENGIFTLKAGQAAVFPEAFENKADSYYVQELLPLNASGQYQGITYKYTGTESITTITEENVPVGETTYTGYKTEDIQPVAGQTATVSYTNTVDTDQMATLQITKKLQDGDTANSEDVFQMQVKVNDEPIAEGTTYTVGGESKTVETEGIIELKADETATIPMLADSTYEVQEVNLDTDLYEFGSYQKNEEALVEDVNTAITGTIDKPKQEDTVTVTNKVVPPVSDESLANKPTYQKQAVDDDKDGIYDLNLSVSGSATSSTSGNQPINVLFVVDISSSMRDGFTGYDNRMAGANDAMSILTNALSQGNGYDARFAMVTFHGRAKYETTWTTNAALINAEAMGPYSGKGTNYEAAIKKAKDAIAGLPEDRVSAPTAVIFISDGEPNEYYYNDRWPNYPYDRNGGEADSATALRQAQEELNTLSGIQYFYTVGVGSESNYSSLKNFKANEEYGIKNGYFPGNDETQLKSAFEKIVAEVTYKAFSNVTINDSLSDYVEVQNETNGDPVGFYIEVIPSAGATSSKSDSQTKNGDGTYTATLELEKTEMNAAATLTATYDPTAKTIVLDFPNDYKLENQWTYKVHINIQPNSNAETAYINAGYAYPTTNVTGTLLPNPPAGQAVAGTGTCANKVGFYSNKNATVTYTAQDGKRYMGTYEKPVVQLQTATVTVTKNFAELETNEVPSGFEISVNGGKKILNGTSATKSDNGKTWSWTLDLPVDQANGYTLTENKYTVVSNVQKLLAKVQVAGTDTDAPTVPENQTGAISLGSISITDTNAKTVAVTNTYKEANGDLTITKKLNSFNKSMGSDATFQFEITNKETGMVWYRYLTFTDKGELKVTLEDIPAGEYTVEELPCAGYSLVDGSESTQEITVSGGVEATVTFTNKSNGGNTPGDQDIVRNNFTYDSDAKAWVFTQEQKQN